jgi:serine/threonine-protein kinase
MNQEDLIADLAIEWEESLQQGRELPIDELCRDHPHLKSAVAARIDALRAMAWMDNDTVHSQDITISVDGSGRVLNGRYELKRLVGRGGFGEVYEAYDRELGRVVAIKIPNRPGIPSKHLEELLRQEGQKLAQLRHHGLVMVHDVGFDGDLSYLVTDYIVGEDLEQRLRREPLLPDQSVRLMAEVADAVAFAHQKGFVHRDIKPSNILLHESGRPVVADFGIAMALNEDTDSTPNSGTLPYMAPEQVRPEPELISERTDIHALGVVLYEMLSGHLPYQAEKDTALRKQILTISPPPLPESVPPAVKDIVRRCLAKHPTDRFESASQLAEALRDAIQPDSTIPASRWERWRNIILGLVVLGLVGLAAYVLMTPQKSSPTLPNEKMQDAIKEALADPEKVRILAKSTGALFFDGSVRLVTPIQPVVPSTIEAWVYPEKYEYRCHSIVGGDVPGKFGLGLSICGVLASAEYVSGMLKSEATVPLKQWSHLAVVYAPNETRLYLNGKQVATGPPSGEPPPTHFVIGNAGENNPMDYFLGKIREVRIWPMERYDEDFTPSQMFYRGLESVEPQAVYMPTRHENGVVKDQSGNQHDAKLETLPSP